MIGIGINLRMSNEHAQEITQPWINLDAALAARGRAPVSRNALAQALLRELDASLRAYATQGFEPLAAAWQRLDLLQDQAVRVQAGERVIEGVARGIDAQGALMVDAAGQRHHLNAGEVSLRLA